MTSSRDHPLERLQRGSQAKSLYAGSVGKRGTSREIALTKRRPNLPTRRVRETERARNSRFLCCLQSGTQKKKRKKKSSRQGKPANLDKGGWVHPKRTSPVTEVEETSVVEVNNPYQPLEIEVTESEEFCPSAPMLPEKRKLTRQHPKPKVEREGKNQPALKVAGGGPNSVPKLTATEIKERPEVVRDPCDSKTSTLTG